ncbi:hypothetical protein AB0A76_09120 [Streptomyces exfoliatus]|uniref:Uncharacterized protein n=1 Tax=Streptomyces exfoliatus TaxID=1905 RepID=A0ABV3CT16_STREX
MDRIYMNRIEGQRRIHVEIHENEVSDLLDDLKADPEHFASTRLFLGILRVAEEIFLPAVSETRCNRDAARQASGQQPDNAPCVCDNRPEECAAVGQPDPTTADDPTPLRWGLGDVLHSDDDTVIVCLSGPDREPYWLELDPERAQALRDDLAAGLSDTQPTNDEAHPPRNTWRTELLDVDGWMPSGLAEPSRTIALDALTRRRAARPSLTYRLVRETTTWTVEEDETR